MVCWLPLFPGQGRGFIDDLTHNQLGVTAGKNTPLLTEVFLELDEDEADGAWSFRALVGSLMSFANQTRPDISNAVRAVTEICASPPRSSIGRLREGF